MKFFVRVTAPVFYYMINKNLEPGLKTGNLRGEPRWERNCAEALLEKDHIVYVPANTWPNSPFGNLINDFPVDCKDIIYIVHGSPRFCPIIDNCKFYFLHFFNYPDEQNRKNIYQIINNYQNRVIVTHSFPICFKEFKQSFPNNFEHLTYPYLSKVDYLANQFNKKILLWSGRGFGNHSKTPEGIKIAYWVKQKLAEDKNIKFAFFSGYINSQNLSLEELYKQNTDYPFLEILKPFKEQIIIYPALDWINCLNVLKETKMIIHFPQRFGGPTVEAAALGIPSIGLLRHSNFDTNMPEYLYPGKFGPQSTIVNLLEKLYTDETFYHKTGDAFRIYVDKHYTYNAFVKNIMNILKKRNIE